MLIVPAIYLYEGKAVLLEQGDYEKMTVLENTPLELADKWKQAGAKWVHIVDLEGARDGGTPNRDTVAEIAEKTGLFVEIGGGVRNMDTIASYFSAGVKKVILGTAAVLNEDLVVEATRRYGSRIVVGADVREGKVAIKGWTQSSAYSLEEFCDKMQDKGVRRILCTDVLRNGTMIGVDKTMYRRLCGRFGMKFLAAGGISSEDDLESLKEIGLSGAIIGSAFYSGKLDPKIVIKKFAEPMD